MGKSSRCPRCNTVVTCPEPVYEAEVVVTNPGSATPPAFNPYDDLDDGTPYAVADQAPAAEDFSVARQPCPACGEMIVATAARCRFCGEVFGPVAPKPKSKKSKKKSRAAAAGGGSKTGLGELLGGLACFGLGTALTVAATCGPPAIPTEAVTLFTMD